MTGIKKTLLITGGIAALGAAAYFISKLKKDVNTVFGFPSIFGLVNTRYIRLIIPVDIFNYTGFGIKLKRFRIRVMYITLDKDNREVENVLGISPTVIPSVTFNADLLSPQKFSLDVDPLVIATLKSTTPLRIYVDFTVGFIPVTLTFDKVVEDIVPIKSIGNTITSLLSKIGINLKLNGLGCACKAPHKPLKLLPPQKPSTVQGIWNLQGLGNDFQNMEVL